MPLNSGFMLLCCCCISAAQRLYDPEFHASDKASIYEQEFDKSKLAYKTKFIQKAIYDHQNPKSCQGVTMWASYGFNKGGLGGELFTIASQLSYAMQNGAVLVWARPLKSKYTSEEHDFGHLFQPLSHCELNLSAAELARLPRENEMLNLFVIPSHVDTWMKKHMPMLTHAQALFWWKTQSVAYVMRLSNQSLATIKDLRLRNQVIVSRDGASRKKKTASLKKWPPGTVNIHIRRGNKIGEMDYVPVEEYGKAYNQLVASQPLSFPKRWVYVTSDTLQVIEEAIDWLLSKSRAHTIVYSVMPRMKTGFDHFEWGQFAANNRTHNSMLLFMELLMAVEADAWIGTRMSCWGRIIDMLRCVWVDKCDAPFVEVGVLQGDDHHMYHEFFVPKHAPQYGKQMKLWAAPPSSFLKSDL